MGVPPTMSLHPCTLCFPKCLQAGSHALSGVIACVICLLPDSPLPLWAFPLLCPSTHALCVPKSSNRCTGCYRRAYTCRARLLPCCQGACVVGNSHIKTNVYLPLYLHPSGAIACHSFYGHPVWVGASCLEGNSLCLLPVGCAQPCPITRLCLALIELQL